MKRQKQLWMVLALLIGSAILLSSCGQVQKETKLIPKDVLFGNPEKVSPRLSPDGTMMSYRAPVDGVMNVFVGTIGKDDAKVVTKDTLRGISRYFWAADSKHIMYLQDNGGDENWKLYSVGIETLDFTCLTPFDDVAVQIIDRNKHFPDELIIGMNKEDSTVHDVYHLDLLNGDLTMVAKNPGNVAGWMTDAQFKVRGALMANAQAGFDLMIRDTEKDDWQLLVSWDSQDAFTSGPLHFTLDGKSIYIQDSRDANASRLMLLNIATGETEVIAEDPMYDVGGVVVHPDTYEIQAVIFEKDRQEITILDESIREDYEAIRKLHHGDIFITSRDDADDTWLVGFTADDGPVPYFSYDRKTKTGTHLFDHRPDLNNYELARMEPISFESRDGLTLHGYITYPIGVSKTNLPMVLNVHGGPWYRDSWGYNPEAQWFANRGYVCLQINFRGSTGYGKDFVNASNREWGGKMHDDLVDGVNWAVDQGIADPTKVAIYGGSYGGYAALVGATFTPDLFCCAVDIVGPSNLISFINTIPPYWSSFLEIMYERVGNPETDEEFLKSRSPLFKADQIKIPMLIAQGANDPRVKQAEAEQIVQALKDNGVEHQYMLFPDEGHGFARPENRLKFYGVAEEFLAKHLGGRFEGSTEGASN